MQKRWLALPLSLLMTACTQTGQYPVFQENSQKLYFQTGTCVVYLTGGKPNRLINYSAAVTAGTWMLN